MTIFIFRISPLHVFLLCRSSDKKAAKLLNFVTYIHFIMKRHVCLTVVEGEAVSVSFCLVLKLSAFSSFSFFFLIFNLWFQVQFVISVDWNTIDYQGTSRCHTRRMTVFQNKLCSPLGSGMDEYMRVTRHEKQFWKVNPMLCLNVKETIYSFWWL